MKILLISMSLMGCSTNVQLQQLQRYSVNITVGDCYSRISDLAYGEKLAPIYRIEDAGVAGARLRRIYDNGYSTEVEAVSYTYITQGMRKRDCP